VNACANPGIAHSGTRYGRRTRALDAMITRQAQIIAYIDDFKLLMIATLAVIPLLVVFKQASDATVKITRLRWNNFKLRLLVAHE